MNDPSQTQIWIVIIGMAIGSFALRFTFLGLVGDRAMPAWLLRHLRYTAVAILPALVAPQVVWPAGTGGEPDAARLIAALVTLVVGLWTRNIYASMGLGGLALWLGLTAL